jgi:CRP/FNR family cyclic AMP-dependent transcriptional regulator
MTLLQTVLYYGCAEGMGTGGTTSGAVEGTMTLAEPLSAEVEFLSHVNLFADLSPADLAEIAATLKRRSCRKGEIVYHQDDPAGSLFIIVKGAVKMQASSATGRQITIGWLKAGRFFGTISLYSDALRPENAIALEACELLVLPREEYRSFVRRHPNAAEAILRVLSERWRRAIQRLCDMACLDVPGRIAKILLDFSPTFGEVEADGSVVIRDMTQPELASLVGATRESVHNALHAFARQGWIEFQRGSIRILDPDGLQQKLAS